MFMKRSFITAGLLAAAIALPQGVGAQTLTIGLKAEPSSIDPHYHNLTPNNAMARDIFDRLIMPDKTQQLKPGLAVSWTPINDLTWEIKLRQGVKFHDGSPFTADDVVFTFGRAQNVPNSPSSRSGRSTAIRLT
jgi:peptide/nickel transport system substrate-binding protein